MYICWLSMHVHLFMYLCSSCSHVHLLIEYACAFVHDWFGQKLSNKIGLPVKINQKTIVWHIFLFTVEQMRSWHAVMSHFCSLACLRGHASCGSYHKPVPSARQRLSLRLTCILYKGGQDHTICVFFAKGVVMPSINSNLTLMWYTGHETHMYDLWNTNHRFMGLDQSICVGNMHCFTSTVSNS